MPVNLQLLIDDNQTTAVPGASVTYLVTVSNFGDAVDASVSVPVPPGVTSAGFPVCANVMVHAASGRRRSAHWSRHCWR